MRRSIKGALLLLLAISSTVTGQNYVNNPYTRFAIGDLMNSGFSYNKSLGGSSIGIRPSNQINYLNPASYTAQDTLSFLFHAGMSGRLSTLSTESEKDHSNNMNVDNFAMGFPITRWWKFSLGLVPYSRVQYLFRENINSEDNLIIEHKGQGGYNKFYFGTGIQLTKFLSAGVNANYLFGSLNRERSIDIAEITVASTKITEEYVASDFNFCFGLQAHPTFVDKNDHKHTFVFGATYDLVSDIEIDYSAMTSRNFPSHVTNPIIDTFNIIADSKKILTLPGKLGLGLSYNYDEKLMLTMEYSKQKFSEGLGIFNSDVYDLVDYSSYRFGVEYVPTPMSSRTRAQYFERIHYRLGGHYSNSYLSMADQQIADYGISIGLGLPWRNSQRLYTPTAFNISYEYGVRGTTNNGLIKENYHVITFGVSLFDFWFLKAKYD